VEIHTSETVLSNVRVLAIDQTVEEKGGQRVVVDQRAFPDSLDLLLICVEAGMSIEAAFRKVSETIGSQSIPLAEEMTLTTAELSYTGSRTA
jgi:tight adherence protein C